MAGKTTKAAAKQVHCPFCDEAIVKAAFPFCQSCGIELIVCTECGQAMASTKRVCPSCGARVTKSKAKAK